MQNLIIDTQSILNIQRKENPNGKSISGQGFTVEYVKVELLQTFSVKICSFTLGNLPKKPKAGFLCSNIGPKNA